jgi:hypothetical protein
MFFAIALTGNKNYMLVNFNTEAERNTVVKYSNGFIPIKNKEVDAYISKNVMHLCNGKCGVVYNQDGVCCGKFESLYKPLHQQSAYRPEDNAARFVPEVKRKNIIDGRTPYTCKR